MKNNKRKAKQKSLIEGQRLYQKYFKFPLQMKYGVKVMTSDFNMAFDFPHEWLYENAFKLSEKDKENIVRILNGEDATIEGLGELTYDIESATINANGQPFIIIRSWGRLTGCGGNDLPAEEAAKIQDDFAQFIIERLSMKKQ